MGRAVARAEHAGMAPGRVRVVRSGSGCPRFAQHVLHPARLGAVQLETRPGQHTSGVERAVSNTTRNRGGLWHGDDQDQQQLSIVGSIRRGTAAPPAVLVADMGEGPLRLQNRDDGPSAYLNPPDVEPLTRKPAVRSASTELALRGGHGEAR
jgi:hypothetical protein